MKNSQRQLKSSVRWPPRVGPIVGARVTMRPTTTLAVRRFSGGKTVMAVAKIGGIIAPANSPCRALKPIIIGTLEDRPVPIEVSTKPTQAIT